MSVICERCHGRNHNRKDRYCYGCKKIVLAEMERSGYLQDTYVPPYFSDMRGRKGLRGTDVLAGTPH